MIFDLFARLCERHYPILVPILKQARLFHFPAYAQTFLAKEHSEEERKFMQEMFFLPFPVIAVEDKVSCILMWDAVKDQRGINQRRFVAECLPALVPEEEGLRKDEPCSVEEYEKTISDLPPKTATISVGKIDSFIVESQKRHLIEGSLQDAFLASKKGGLLVSTEKMKALRHGNSGSWENSTRAFLRNVCTALEEVAYLNTPDRFILEKSPFRGSKKKKQQTGIARSHDRPIYTLLRPKEIREEMKLSEPTAVGGLSRRPHERRAHTRTFKSDRFTNKKNKSIIISATWIGPKENIVGKTRYKVLVDL